MTKQTVILGDALEKMAELPAASVDLLVVDPPYNLGKDYGNNYDSKERDEYLDFTRSWTRECSRLLKEGGTIYCFMGFRFISHLYLILEEERNLNFVNWIVWHYTQGMGKTRGFSPRHDDILMFSKGQNFRFFLDNVRVPQKYYRERNNMRGANPGDVWQFSHVHYCHENRQNHPTQKPEGLVERMVLASTRPGDLVLDPFAGSGTTARVCQQLDRNSINIECNVAYVEMIKSRLAAEFRGFDSIDPRMERVPLDLRRDEIRNVYLEDHKRWFLNHHENAISKFEKSVEELYGRRRVSKQKSNQPEELPLIESEAAE